MKYFSKWISVLLISMFTFTTDSFASINPFELSGQFGLTRLHVGNRILKVTPTETDQLQESSNPTIPELSLGINYIFPLQHNLRYQSIHWFPSIKIGINLRYFDNQEINGEVFQYQEPTMNNYIYNLSVENVSLMLDVSLTLFSFCEKNSVYILGGIGHLWTNVDYSDIPKPDIFGGALNLDSHTNSSLAYEIGAGFIYPIHRCISLFFEYRYTHIEKIHTGSRGILDGSPTSITPIHFPFFSQNLSLGLNWKI